MRKFLSPENSNLGKCMKMLLTKQMHQKGGDDFYCLDLTSWQ